MRHTSLDKLARDPNVNDYVLRQHAGWSKRSDMVEVYTHELKGDSVEHVMLAYGINIKEKRDKSAAQLRQEMVGPHCPFCHTVNIPGTTLCASCHRPISVVSYDTVMKELVEVQRNKQELAALNEKIERIQESIQAKDIWIEESKKSIQEQKHYIAETTKQIKELEYLRDVVDKAMISSSSTSTTTE